MSDSVSSSSANTISATSVAVFRLCASRSSSCSRHLGLAMISNLASYISRTVVASGAGPSSRPRHFGVGGGAGASRTNWLTQSRVCVCVCIVSDCPDADTELARELRLRLPHALTLFRISPRLGHTTRMHHLYTILCCIRIWPLLCAPALRPCSRLRSSALICAHLRSAALGGSRQGGGAVFAFPRLFPLLFFSLFSYSTILYAPSMKTENGTKEREREAKATSSAY